MEKLLLDERIQEAVMMTAPGTALRTALDMILAARLGALICIGDTDKVLANGNDGFPLNISFTSHRLFELSKMDGSIVVDEDVSNILRANFHLNPDPSLPTSETGMRHRTAARMSMGTDAIVISVSARRAVVNIYSKGKSYQLRPSTELINEANQLLIALQTGKSSLDKGLVALSSLEFDNFVTLGDITRVFARFQTLIETAKSLEHILLQMGVNGRMLKIQLRELTHGVSEQFNLAIRDYAADSSEENAHRIREEFSSLSTKEMTSPAKIAEVLGYENLDAESTLTPLGLRTLSRISVIDYEMADRLVDQFGSLQGLMDSVENNPDHLDTMGVANPSILVDSLYRMWGKR